MGRFLIQMYQKLHTFISSLLKKVQVWKEKLRRNACDLRGQSQKLEKSILSISFD